MKKVVTWVAVVDHQSAKIYENDGPNRGINLLDEHSQSTHLRANRDLLTDRPGRGTASRGGRQHGMELRTDPHRQEGIAFIEDVAEKIANNFSNGRFDRLVLVAPPRALGELRAALPEPVKKTVLGELDQDLTKASRDEVLRHLSNYLAA